MVWRPLARLGYYGWSCDVLEGSPLMQGKCMTLQDSRESCGRLDTYGSLAGYYR